MPASKKLTTETKKRNVVGKKTVVKKTTAKKPVKKLVKKTAVKKTTSKAVSTKRTKVTSGQNQPQKISTSSSTNEVTLPTNMSQRAIEKTIVLARELDANFRVPMFKIAYVSGLCFLAVGGTLLASDNINLAPVDYHLSANVSESGDPTGDTQIPNAQFQALTTLPDTIATQFEFSFKASYAKKIEVKLIALDHQDYFEIPFELVEENRYVTYIAGDTLDPGMYALTVFIQPANGDDLMIRQMPPFYGGEEEYVEEEATDPEPSPTNESEASADGETEETTAEHESTDPAAADESNVVPDDAATETEAVEIDSNEQDGSSSSSGSGSGSSNESEETEVDEEGDMTEGLVEAQPILKKPTDSTDDDNIEIVEKPDYQTPKFDLRLTGTNHLTAKAHFYVELSADVRYVELYLRPVNSLHERFVTLAVKRYGAWEFFVDTTNIPNGRYEFFARTTKDGKTYESDSVKAEVENIFTYQKPVVTANEPAAGGDSLEAETVTADPVREFVSLAEPDLPIEETTVEPVDETRSGFTVSDQKDNFPPDVLTAEPVATVKEKTDLIFTDNAKELEDLFKRYAVAQQSGDKMLIDTAKDELKKAQREIALRSLNSDDPENQGLADDVDKEVQQRIEKIQARVETFETIRRERTEGESSIDTDEDGISDFDERTLYGTDPNVGDTDNDGVTDGVEIMRGYNPVDAGAEAVIAFESPKQSIGLERDEVLVIEQVRPVVVADTNTPTKAEIRGKGLPNSFVTLYIFSDPTVVTVRTDADGSFVYTFDKELDDGQHDVYVAVTDNAGGIVAQSKPFTFVKEAQAFTPVDAEEETVVTAESIMEAPKGDYNTVVGLGIFALGAILLMLGIGLRGKNEADDSGEAETQVPDSSTGSSLASADTTTTIKQ
jgi:hypothetical protein